MAAFYNCCQAFNLGLAMFDDKARSKAFQKCEKQVAKWLADEKASPYFVEIPKQSRHALTANQVLSLDLNLAIYANFMCGVSANQLLVEKDYDQGMESLCQSYSYYILAHRFLLINEKKRGALFRGYAGRANGLIGILALALFFDDRPSVEMLVDYINGMAASGELESELIDMPYAEFMKGLTRLYLKKEFSVGDLPDTVHSQIFKTWESKIHKENIEEILDQHLMEAIHKKGYEKQHTANFPDIYYVPAFDQKYVMLMPLEVMALYGTFDALELSVPNDIDHPIFPTGFWDKIKTRDSQACSDEFTIATEAYLASI